MSEEKDQAEKKPTNKGGAYSVEAKDAAWQVHVELFGRYMDRPKGEAECNPDAILTSLEELFQARTEIFRGAGSKSIRTMQKFIPFLEGTIRPFVQKWQKERDEGALNGEYMLNKRRPVFYEEMKPIYSEIQDMCDLMAKIAGIENLADE